MKLGVNYPFRSTFEAGIGLKVDYVRYYLTSQTPPDSSWSTVGTLAAAGYLVAVNIHCNATWANAATGAEDARWDAIASYLATITPAGILTLEAEPENNGQTATNYRAMQTRFFSRMHTIAPFWGYWHNLMANTWYTTQQNPDDWIGDGLGADGIAVDYYNWRGATSGWAVTSANDRNPSDLFTTPTNAGRLSPIDYAVSKGLPFQMMEYGCAVDQPGGDNSTQAQKRAAWLQRCSDLWSPYYTLGKFDAIYYFEQDPGPYWRISGGSNIPSPEPPSLAAFASFATVEPPPPPPDAGTWTPGVWPIHQRLFGNG